MPRPEIARCAIVCATLALGALASTAFAGPDNASQIEAFCAARFAQDANAQRTCREDQKQAAARLMDRIEMAEPTSREYKAASACIERAKIAQPAQIDWPKALRCFEQRTEIGAVANPPEATEDP